MQVPQINRLTLELRSVPEFFRGLRDLLEASYAISETVKKAQTLCRGESRGAEDDRVKKAEANTKP